MEVAADGLTWRATLPLELGVYQYKFVLDGDSWISDPTTQVAPDAGGFNFRTPEFYGQVCQSETF